MTSKGVSLGSSGLDIDTLVTNSVAKYQTNYDKKYKAKVSAEWTKSAYSDIYSALKDFRTGTASDYKLSSNTVARTATSTLSAITATANADAVTMTHDVTVSKLASSAMLQTASGSKVSKSITSGTSTTTSIKLADVAGIDTSTGADTDTALSFTIGDGSSTKTISYTYLQLKGGTDASGNTVAAKTLNDFASDIKAAGLNVGASYDSVNDSFSLYNSKSGSANTVEITLDQDTSGTTTTAGTNAKSLFTAFNLSSYDSSTKATTALSGSTTLSLYDGTIKGTDATFTVDGKSYTKDSNVNTINGVTYTFNDITSTTGKVTIGTDSTALVAKVQKFVDSYNALLSKLNTKIYETKDSNYGPLTDAEKKEMSDTQVTDWETKAKTGLLSKNTILSNTVNEMRSAISDKVDSVSGKYDTLSSIGITTTDYLEHGTLHLDTDKLTKAIADDPNCVYNLFASKGSTDETSGVAYRLSAVTSDSLTKISNEAGISSKTDDQSALGVKITKMTSDLKSLQAILSAKETYYYNKYNKMEEAMSKNSSTTSTLSSYLGKSS
ncbi:MAG: flagellar hook protein [Firmicutes bacterium]|nr:flagellar hook protein [Bacillota bacterium]